MRTKSVLLAALLIVAVLQYQAYGESVQTPKLDAVSAILLEASRGQVLFSKNPTQRLHISSASKIMTALLAVENLKTGSKVTISRDVQNVSGEILGLEAGEKYYAEDLISAVLLTSANDVAVALAEWVAGDERKFVELMNKKAKDLKMMGTFFENSTGLFSPSQYTTAEDLAVLVQYALKNPDFNRLFAIKGLPFKSQILTNRNILFWKYEGIDGGKAGYNDKDKQSAITTATRDNQRLIAIVLYSPENSIWNDSVSLLDYGFNNFKSGILVFKGQVLKNIAIGDKDVGLISSEDVYYTYPIGDSYIKRVEFNIRSDLKLPVARNETVGTAMYVLKDGTAIDIPLYPDRDIKPEKGFISYAVDTLLGYKDLLFIIILLLFLEIILFVRGIYRMAIAKKRKRQQKRQ